MFSVSPLGALPPKLSSLSSLSFRLSLPKALSLTDKNSTFSLRHRPLKIQSLDAAQPFDYESKIAAEFHNSRKLKIAIIGFGNYGQFLAETLVRQGHTVLAHSRSDHSQSAGQLGVSFFADPHDLCEEHPEVILLCTSIISTENFLKALPLQRLKRNTLIVDVLSVKEFPKNLLLNVLPNDFDLICTHPMFGPQSARHGWNGLYFVYEKVRIGTEESRVSRCENFLNVFDKEGCRMVEMSCAEHDKYAAESQFITHTIGRVLEELKLESTPINTKGYEALLDLVENTYGDSFDLFYGLFMYNEKALEMLERLDLAFEALKKHLFGRLHDVVRKQLFGKTEAAQIPREHYSLPMYAQNGHAASASSSVAMRSLDADPTTDNKAQIFNRIEDDSKLKIAVIGFGNFGQFLAKTMVRQGHTVLAYSRSDYSDVAQKLGVRYFSDADDLCEEHPEVVLLCTSILSTDKVIRSLPLHRLKRNTLFVDVLSVKEFPKNLFLQSLPPYFDILCTHPMFGPESGRNGWNSLSFVYDKVRIGSDESRVSRCDRFLDIFAQEGCRMVEMSCSEHDRYAAGSQFITHTMGRILEKLGLKSTPINTKGYETLLKLVENTAGDSFDLYYGLFMYNVNAMEQLEKLDLAFESLKKQLFGRLHSVHRKQLIENVDESLDLQEQRLLPELSVNDNVPSSS
ncbi:hypothetical protein FNV43_RR03497 [Rhamnella rubrinervis]|uniref:Prephenate/arogenate dehydrogenase domain-containing protein n=1 Tax=Rhamnella rubrinervis TaxID=2594499 RepID=A0A8K0MP52_9ROSA|nr:hypothetical protein FNV43_RR03497 [Rhamnella rubrinervis]